MNEFEIKIKEDKHGIRLSVTGNNRQWTSIKLENANQMRQIATALIAKAEEIEGNEEYQYCQYCRTIAKTSEMIKIGNMIQDHKEKQAYYMCRECFEGNQLGLSFDEVTK